MASYTPTASIDDPATSTGANGGAPPAWVDGGGDDFDARPLDARLRRARLGLLVGVVGIVMIFVSFTSAYVVRQGLPTFDSRTNTMVHDWIPVRLPNLLLLNTFVLLLSSITIELARRRAARNFSLSQVASIPGVSVSDEKISWLAMTVVLGLLFLTGQGMAWRELAASGFYISATPSSSFVFLLTGMHGAHLLGGVIALLIAGAASLLHRPAQSQFVWLDVTAWYWHFMAVLWVYILMLLEFVR